jgi:hypothetical protein
MNTTFVPSLFLVLGFLLGTNAQAGAATEIKGTIKVTGANTAGYPPLKCDDLEVVVTSPATLGHTLTPAWQRHANAMGSWASGSCSYAVAVVANNEFYISVYPNNIPVPCDGYNSLTDTPALGWLKLSSGQTKDQEFTLESITCTRL